MPAEPAIRYARTEDGVDVAYWKLGRGPVLLHAPNVQLGHVLSEWAVEGMRRWYEALARSFTVVRYDHRGGGLSSRNDEAQSIDALVRDIDAVVTEACPETVMVLGWISGGLPAIAYAAQNPSRVSHLILWCSFAKNVAHGQAPRMKALFELAEKDWELFTESICQAALGWSDADEARRWAAAIRDGTTQREFLAFLAARRDWDVSAELASITAPALVMHDRDNPLANEKRSRELAAGIPGGRFLLCGSRGGVPDDGALEEMRSFIGAGEGALAGIDNLTAREREVLGLVAAGATNAEIAERLFISIHTVTRHLTHIYAKTGVKGRAQAVRYALERGLGSS